LNTFIPDDFLLENKMSRTLFHGTAKRLPVIDYHNHLDPVHLAENHRFEDLAQLWVIPDQYKHRAMRISGIPEAEITGNVPGKKKFHNWAATLPKTLGNPLFHWSAMELKAVFGVEELLNPENAERIYHHCNERLQSEDLRSISLLKLWNVEHLCTSDDLLDDLQPHMAASAQHGIRVQPSLRGDSIVEVDRPAYSDWLARLSRQTQVDIEDLETYEVAVRQKLAAFQAADCQFADHALDAGFQFQLPERSVAEQLFRQCLRGQPLDKSGLRQLKSFLLHFLGREYAARSWTLQLHIGAQRATSSRLRSLAGRAGGYAAIGQATDISSLVALLDSLEKKQALPRMILYNLNPVDNQALASLTGSFTEDGVAGKVQFGPAWWYNDHFAGIRAQLISLANYGLLHHAIGMTTDSRSILSFSRHEYYRRVLCNLVGEWVEKGHLPADEALLEQLIRAVCYGNIKNWITEKSTVDVNQ
jgi:glucuronate isomerase